MKKRGLTIASAMVAALAVRLVSDGQAGLAPKPRFESEKCSGISTGAISIDRRIGIEPEDPSS